MKKIFLLFWLTSCSWVNMKMGLPDDNLIEEWVETEVETRTGVDVDLTPYTIEYETRTLSPSQPPMRGPNAP